jgi:hypothetical protein
MLTVLLFVFVINLLLLQQLKRKLVGQKQIQAASQLKLAS